MVTAQNNLDLRLEDIHTIAELWQFAGKCLKDPDLKAAFDFLGSDECFSLAYPWDKQLAFVSGQEEHSNLERDLSLFEKAEKEIGSETGTALNSSTELPSSSLASSSTWPTSVFQALRPGKEHLGDPECACEPSLKKAKFSSALAPSAVIDLQSEEESLKVVVC